MNNDKALWLALLAPVRALAVTAGQEILTIYHHPDTWQVHEKTDQTPLTRADLNAHHCITQGLQAINKQYQVHWPILSEESAAVPFSERSQWQTYWLVDPLDGTKEFIKQSGEFSVNIALIHHGRAVLGVVYAPVLQLCYHAAEGAGAWKRSQRSTPEPIQCRLQVKSPFRIAVSRSHGHERLQHYLQALENTPWQYQLIPMGSALKSCLVAEGKADLYPRLGATSEWDTAAAQCVVEQAGGRLVDLSGEPLCYNSKASLENPWFLVFGDQQFNWLKFID